MEAQQYIVSTLQSANGLPGIHELTEGPHSSPLRTNPNDLTTPYSAVSSFNLPAQCDPDLLTPISSAGSPSFDDHRKLMPPYDSPQGSGHVQPPSPPASTKMYPAWAGTYSAQSQPPESTASMAHQAPIAPEYLDPYIHDGKRPPLHHHHYMGHFSVSDGADTGPMQPYYVDVPAMENTAPMVMRHVHPSSLEQPHERSIAPGPLMNMPHHSSLEQRSRGHLNRQSMTDIPDVSRSLSGSPHQQAAGSVQKSTRQRRTPRRQNPSRRKPPQAADPEDEFKNCHGMEEPPRLKNICTEEQRCVFQSRWKHRREKGQNMWAYIQEDVEKNMNKRYTKETLQMVFTRGRPECYEWLPRDEEILREAWVTFERERYQRLRDLFLALGGSRNMDLSPGDIELKIVNDLKLEQNVYVDHFMDVNVRKRRKSRKVGEIKQEEEQEELATGLPAGDGVMDYEMQTATSVHAPSVGESQSTTKKSRGKTTRRR